MINKNIVNVIKFVAKAMAGILVYAILLSCIFMPTYLLLPSQIRSVTYHTSKSLASLFKDFSELQLKHGFTCNQNRTTCIKSLILQGALIPGDEKRFQRLFLDLKAIYPKTNTICFNSPGGYTSVAAVIARNIKDSKFNTCVGDWSISDDQLNLPLPRFTSKCESACAMLVLAGSRRIAIGDRFEVGFHSPQALIEATDPGQENSIPKVTSASQSSNWGVYMSPLAYKDVIEAYQDALSISNSDLKKILIEMSYTPNSKMYFPPIQELKRIDFFNEIVTKPN